MVEAKEHPSGSESILTVCKQLFMVLVWHKLGIYEHCPKLQPYVEGEQFIFCLDVWFCSVTHPVCGEFCIHIGTHLNIHFWHPSIKLVVQC